MFFNSSPLPPDDITITSYGKVKISNLFYKMDPRREPCNRIKALETIFIKKCLSTANINESKKNKKCIKSIYFNEYHNNINNDSINQNTKKNLPAFFDTAVNIISKKKNESNKIIKKGKYLKHNNSCEIKLDKTYYKIPMFNRKEIFIPQKNNGENIEPKIIKYYREKGFFIKKQKILPKIKPKSINFNFDIEQTKDGTLGKLKEYEMKYAQNKNKCKPFIF